MIPPNKRSIRRIPIERAKRTNTATDSTPDYTLEEEPDTPLPPRRDELRGRRAWLWVGGIIIALIIIGVGISTAFAGATLNITPQQEQVTVNGAFDATREPSAGALGFKVMTLTRTAGSEVSATGERQVDTKASGTITIFNNFSEKTERLINNTRFETPEGLIYRLDRSVDVPGRHENADGEIVPGSTDAVVYAETSGEEYNIDRTDFTIPAFEEQGDPRFFKFFARSKTPMVGGFSGIQRTVSESDEEAARAVLRAELQETLQQEAQAQVPDGFILYDDASFVTFETLPNENTDEADTVRVVEGGTLTGIVFDQAELAAQLARATVGRYDGEPVRFINLEDLEVTLQDKETLEPVSLSTISMVFAGRGTLVWTFDETRLKEDLAGKSRPDLETVLSGYPAIERAEIHFRPFWKRTFPSNIDRITIEQAIQSSTE